jgi:N4-gp56 family major capsid protein
MAETLAASGLTVRQWDDRFFDEYVRASRFARYYGTTENAVIHIKENLTKNKGDRIAFALAHELAGAGVTGNTTLEGNEEALDTRSHAITVDVLRHAVMVTDWEEQKSAIGLREAGKVRLRNWAMKRLRADIIGALHSINGTAYGSATEGNKDAWLADNADRVLFGGAVSNNSGNDHSASLGNVDDVAADRLNPALVSLAKRLAQEASPAIRPVVVGEDEEWFVLFTGSRPFRDLRNHADMLSANRDAWTRGRENPLFTGGDLIWDGVIVKEIPEIGTLGTVGGAGAEVGASFLCGAQAIGLAWAQRTRTATQDTDYKFRHGVAIQEIRGVEKLRFGTGSADTDNPVDNGVVTLYTAAEADA